MSILSEWGAFMGQKMGELKNLIDTKIGSQTNQDIEITDASKGIIMKSPSGKRYRITINDEGELTKEELTE
tara:strand:- start:634 stop:846 length:213 start_codon:yes stop_codon:yes gene_type:complete